MAVKIYSVKAELTVLRALFSRRKEVAGTIIAGTDETYFYSDEAKEIYGLVKKSIVDEGGIPKYRLFLDDPGLSKDAREFLRESQALVSDVRDAKRALKTLQKYRLRRGLYEMAQKINDALQSKRFDEQDLLNQTGHAVSAMRAAKATDRPYLHFGKYGNAKEFVTALLHEDRTQDLIPTGLQKFDDWNGGLGRGSLVLLAGNSGAGKSHTALAIAMYMASVGYKVLFIPLEMSEAEMGCRMMANISGVDSLKIWTGRLTDKEKSLVERRYKRWERRTKRKGGNFALYKPDSDITIEEALAATSTYGVDAVFIDYVSLLAGADGDDQWRELGRITRYAKIDAGINNRVNVLVAQLNDEGRLKYSQTMRENANNLFAFTADRNDKESGLRRVEQLKARNQIDRPFTIKIDLARSRVETVDNDGDGGQPSTLPNLADGPDV